MFMLVLSIFYYMFEVLNGLWFRQPNTYMMQGKECRSTPGSCVLSTDTSSIVSGVIQCSLRGDTASLNHTPYAT